MAHQRLLLLLGACVVCSSYSLAATTAPVDGSGATPEARVCRVFCEGEILSTFMQSNISLLANDSKTFVDMPLAQDPEAVAVAFKAMKQRALPDPPSQQDLETFLQTHFLPAGSDLEPWTPPDWQQVPLLLREATPNSSLAQNQSLRGWVLAINQLWRLLGRKPAQSVLENPQRHTLLRTPHPLIVPGGRFRESYYWDTYWIVLGLIESGMNSTAIGVVENLLFLCDKHGFVPNGGRAYYLTRSQPPLLSEMVTALLEAYPRLISSTTRKRWLSTLYSEYTFWQSTRRSTLVGAAVNDCSLLNRYDANTSLPRPESWREDVNLAHRAASRGAEDLYRSIAAGAETGWDFSSRWFDDPQDMQTIHTEKIVPVELNGILLRMELNLYRMSAASGNDTAAGDFLAAARSRWSLMEHCMWNDTQLRWNDLRAPDMVQQYSKASSVANWALLWPLAAPEAAHLLRVDPNKIVSAIQSLQESGLCLDGGIATTGTIPVTHQQWDFPNAWPPLQHVIISSLHGIADWFAGAGDRPSDASLVTAFANTLMQRWITTSLLAWNRTGHMYEKYDAASVGHGGGGGEYVPQVGFGWTNGVILHLLGRWNTRGTSKDVCF